VNPAVIALMILLGQAGAPTPGPEPKARAQALLSEGATLYESGDFAAALRKFTAAYAIYPSPKLWLNIGQAQRDLGRPLEAMESFERFIAEADDPPADALAEAHRSVAELQLQLGRVAVDCDIPSAEVSLDGKIVGRTPLSRPLWTTPGQHRLAVRRQGYVSDVQMIEAVGGKARRVSVRLRAVDLTIPTTPSPQTTLVEQPRDTPSDDAQGSPFYARWPFWAAVGGAVLVGGILIAATSSHTSIPKTDLGSQNAF
jgi:hypothetical protein